MSSASQRFSAGRIETSRHATSWIEAGPKSGPLMILVHGWPEVSIVWRHQLEYFAAAGWRCVAPDMRGYGSSSAPDQVSAYAMREICGDMVELHDALGAQPAVWVGHDWGSGVVWSIAAHHRERCRAIVNMCVPYFARGMTLDAIVSTVDREIYPVASFPVGQWDYWLYHRQQFRRSADDLGADVRGTVTALYRTGSRTQHGTTSPLSRIRVQGGWFGHSRRPPEMIPDERMLSAEDFEIVVQAFERTGFAGANAWYLNDVENAAFAATAPEFGVISTPVLFLHAAWDTTCDTLRTTFADPMRADCVDLTERTIEAGHELMIEQPAETNSAIAEWLLSRAIGPVADGPAKPPRS